ncbi:hypothetical protein GQ53DRAFT_753873, partial [Thozetella sp. PMI_491]
MGDVTLGLRQAILCAALMALVPGALSSLLDSPTATSGRSAEPISQRQDTRNEHVVLADCRDASNKVSSQMAYFPNQPNAYPQDVAVVNTADGQAALWVSTTTKGLFTDTGTTFTAVLGPKVADGEYAGSGNNGYGNFSCWQIYNQALYTYDNTTCSQVYDCDHRSAPSVLPTPLTDSHELSVGAVAGIAVGVSGAVLLLGAGVVYYYLRRRRRRVGPGSTASRTLSSSSRGGLLGMFKKRNTQLSSTVSTTYAGSPETAVASAASPKPGRQELYSVDNYTYELEAQHMPFEMPGKAAPQMLDSTEPNKVQRREQYGLSPAEPKGI